MHPNVSILKGFDYIKFILPIDFILIYFCLFNTLCCFICETLIQRQRLPTKRFSWTFPSTMHQQYSINLLTGKVRDKITGHSVKLLCCDKSTVQLLLTKPYIWLCQKFLKFDYMLKCAQLLPLYRIVILLH